MRVLESKEHTPDEIYGRSGMDRSEGLHLSDLIDRVLAAQKQTYRNSTWNKHSLFEVGFTWEAVIEDGFRRRRMPVIRPEEITLDGVIGSPDGYNYRTGELQEYKATYKSMRTFAISNQMRWLMQSKGYMKMCSGPNRIVTVCNWWVFFVRGDYDSGPACRNFRVEFTPEEIDNNWSMLIAAKKEGE